MNLIPMGQLAKRWAQGELSKGTLSRKELLPRPNEQRELRPTANPSTNRATLLETFRRAQERPRLPQFAPQPQPPNRAQVQRGARLLEAFDRNKGKPLGNLFRRK